MIVSRYSSQSPGRDSFYPPATPQESIGVKHRGILIYLFAKDAEGMYTDFLSYHKSLPDPPKSALIRGTLSSIALLIKEGKERSITFNTPSKTCVQSRND
jgi:hypothetical protein